MHDLLARIIWADAVTAVLAPGGVYAAGVIGWRTVEILLYAAHGTLLGSLGGDLIPGRL